MVIALISAHAECLFDDPDRHGNHLWHTDLLTRAGRIAELAERAVTGKHAGRRLNRSLRELAMESVLRDRAEGGDHDAPYVSVRLMQEAEKMVQANAGRRQLAGTPMPTCP
ncbi:MULTISPECIES: hypothetical protein [Streptomyces]|uniref:Uncharacterized protein n=1 Tax=Streptomyces clavifer TaxID=68188 RepID=A0ABS4VHQ1_9ACTN|nr:MULTISPECIES: hypothetical protein [Streptomyces]MBP2363448.1 hypothetical protein [Streptomyces clavifer]MDX2748167.1 hypothetical protein [Streptomyces sp. NRRL_B-2557]GHB28007.1 hypothetical protein GCM10010392_65200 [Streptomyces clavifer]